MGAQDLNIKRPYTVSSVPSGPANTTQGTITVAAATVFTVSVTTYPDSRTLSIWNFLWSIYIDTNDVNYAWSYGSSLTTTLLSKIMILDHYDWAVSSDSTNQRVQIITIVNNDTASHTFFLNYKSYTESSSAGSG